MAIRELPQSSGTRATQSATRKAGSSGEPRTVEKDSHSKSWAQATGLRLQGSETSEYLERPSHVAEQHTETNFPRTARPSSLRHGAEVRQRSPRNRSNPDIYNGRVPSFGNNELGQSQFTKSRTLSIRLASGKKQARTTTGRLDESFIQKA